MKTMTTEKKDIYELTGGRSAAKPVSGDQIEKIERILQAARQNPHCSGVTLSASAETGVEAVVDIRDVRTGKVEAKGVWVLFQPSGK